VDCSQPAGVYTVKRIGRKYGWTWGEVPSEWWHVTFTGRYTGPNPGPGGLEPPLRQGSRGNDVQVLQKRLKRLGYHPLGDELRQRRFGPQTEQVVKRFQRNQNMKADGVVGPGTQKELKAALKRVDTYRCTPRERELIGRWLSSHTASIEKALVEQRQRLYRVGEKEGWGKHDRRIRYQTLVQVTGNHAKVHVR
jgi:hypothetical protein